MINIIHKLKLRKIRFLYAMSLFELVYRASQRHRRYFPFHKIQMANLLSIKTGACPEDCSYCSQSSHYKTFVESEKLLSEQVIKEQAKRAKAMGATRFCMGAAWRSVPEGERFERLLSIVKNVSALGMQVCCSMGMLNLKQAKALKHAGLYAYNHNIDTSPSFYSRIISTRTFQDRLDSIKHIQDAGLSLCCGGILGLGESHEDRIQFIHTLSQMRPLPESIPINTIVPVEGTKLESASKVDIWDMLRVISVVRCIIPKSVIRLSAGRLQLSQAEQALCFFAGANSIFVGDKLLTTANNDYNHDLDLIQALGLEPALL